MSEKIIRGTYADFKIVKTRGVAQFVIEIPIDHAQEAIQMFGVPTPESEQWVAVAALHKTQVLENEAATKAIQQAGMLCKTPDFGTFLRDAVGLDSVQPDSPESIADALRTVLGVQSRRDFHTDEDALEAFHRVKGEYDQWLMTR